MGQLNTYTKMAHKMMEYLVGTLLYVACTFPEHFRWTYSHRLRHKMYRNILDLRFRFTFYVLHKM